MVFHAMGLDRSRGEIGQVKKYAHTDLAGIQDALCRHATLPISWKGCFLPLHERERQSRECKDYKRSALRAPSRKKPAAES